MAYAMCRVNDVTPSKVGANPRHLRSCYSRSRLGGSRNIRQESVGTLGKRIYVGNLPFSASEDEVRDLFAVYGEVESVALPMDRDTGRMRGFGFVEMADNDANQAIEALDGTEMDGRQLRINEARPREPRR